MDSLNLIGGFNPYVTPLTAADRSFPFISKFGIGKFLIDDRHNKTREEFANWRSFDAYKHFQCGWVLEMRGRRFADLFLVTGRVRHSQSVQATPLKPFLILKKSEEVVSAHCDCVVGLGQCCVHVGALLWALDHHCQSTEETVTDRLAYWPVPGRRNIEVMARCDQIEFSLPNAPSSQRDLSIPPVPEPTEEEVADFLHDLNDSGISAAILEATPPYSGKMDKGRLDILFCGSLLQRSLPELMSMKSRVDLQMAQDDCDRIERATRNQAASHLWFRFRVGRITASVFKRTCRTQLGNPSRSLLQTICRPIKFRPTKAMKYGCDHETDAISAFKSKMAEEDPNMIVSKCGFFIDRDHPCFGASPDAMAECPCHGRAAVEAKCPYCAREQGVLDYAAMKRSCLMQMSDGSLHLDRNHEYFYQIQMQMALTKCEIAYFVLWTKEACFTEVIELDHQFWQQNSARAQAFWDTCVLPELLCRYYTAQNDTPTGGSGSPSSSGDSGISGPP